MYPRQHKEAWLEQDLGSKGLDGIAEETKLNKINKIRSDCPQGGHQESAPRGSPAIIPKGVTSNQP